MENATKALLISAGILISVMILSLVVIIWRQFSAYYQEKNNSVVAEQNAQFNSKFENYNGQTIRGNELISVMNKVINYNNTEAKMEGYDRIIISVDNLTKSHLKQFMYNPDTDSSIFTLPFSNTFNNDDNIKLVTDLPSKLISQSGIEKLTDEKMQKLSAEIFNILGDNISQRNKKIMGILGGSEPSTLEYAKIGEITKKYYQYTQFKRAMFKCTSVEYNQSNGRVNAMKFEIVIDEDGKIKFN